MLTAKEAHRVQQENKKTTENVLPGLFKRIEFTAKEGYNQCSLYQWGGVSQEVFDEVASVLTALGYRTTFCPKVKDGDVDHLDINW